MKQIHKCESEVVGKVSREVLTVFALEISVGCCLKNLNQMKSIFKWTTN